VTKELIPSSRSAPGTDLDAAVDAAARFVAARRARATRPAYASDWREFAVWCTSRSVITLSAELAMVAAFAGL
jgi:hypothetical protein